jgi:hypothetical protein
VKEFRRLAFEGVTDKLENPSDEEQSQRVHPQAVNEDAGDENWHRKQDGRDAQRVTNAVHRMLMTGSILRDPLLVAASAQHVGDDITSSARASRRDGRLATLTFVHDQRHLFSFKTASDSGCN